MNKYISTLLLSLSFNLYADDKCVDWDKLDDTQRATLRSIHQYGDKHNLGYSHSSQNWLHFGNYESNQTYLYSSNNNGWFPWDDYILTEVFINYPNYRFSPFPQRRDISQEQITVDLAGRQNFSIFNNYSFRDVSVYKL